MNSFDDLLKAFYEIITFDLFIKLVVIYFFIIWISIIVWVLKDITNRTNSLMLQLLSLFIVVFLTPLGVFLYLLIRPGKTNLEKMYREIDDNLDLLSTIMKDKYGVCETTRCPNCSTKLSSDFKYCPVCSIKVKTTCRECKKEIDPDWKVCPYCSKKVKEKEEDQDKKNHKKD
ncbi:hypothetical protein EOM39_03575 [Candidatus Gracilibacteria bacterium]|nr:hypothetical protein [Candidatus Gracilibacteria bacterium]